jgi:ATP-dependent DNA helicase RecG
MMERKITCRDSVQFVKGVGPRRAELLNTVGIETVFDLLRYFPRRWLDRSDIKPFNALQEGEQVSTIGTVVSHGMLKGRRSVFEVLLSDGNSYLTLTWFKGFQYLKKRFKRGDVLAVSGSVSFFNGPQLIHPEFENLDDPESTDKLIHSGRIIPLYPSTAELKGHGLDSRGLRRIIRNAIDKYVPVIEDYLPESLIIQNRLMALRDALKAIHYPDSDQNLNLAKERLVFDELFLLELRLALAKTSSTRRRKQHSYIPPSTLLTEFYELSARFWRICRAHLPCIAFLWETSDPVRPWLRSQRCYTQSRMVIRRLLWSPQNFLLSNTSLRYRQ